MRCKKKLFQKNIILKDIDLTCIRPVGCVKPLLKKIELRYATDDYITQEMCKKAVQEEPKTLKFVSNEYKKQEIYQRPVESDPSTSCYVPGECKSKVCFKDLFKKIHLYGLMFVTI